MKQVLESPSAVPPVEWIAVGLALAYLVLAVRQHIACWVFAASSSAIFLWLFARADLLMQSALQVFYIAMAAYGWYSWRGGLSAAQAPQPVVRWPLRRHAGRIAAIALLSAVSGWLSASETTAAVRYVDALRPGAACLRPGSSRARCWRTGCTGSCSTRGRRSLLVAGPHRDRATVRPLYGHRGAGLSQLAIERLRASGAAAV